MLSAILQRGYKENLLHIITSKEQNSSSLTQKTLLGSHQEKLQVEEQHIRWIVSFSEKKKKVFETKNLWSAGNTLHADSKVQNATR